MRHGTTFGLLLGLTLLLAACAGDPADSALLPGGGEPDCPPGVLVGDTCGGGVVYSVGYPAPDVVLVAALADAVGSPLAYKDSQTTTGGAASTTDGRANTGTFNSSHPASFACQNATDGGYSDWYLPAQGELQALDGGSAVVPALTLGSYWSSTEASKTAGWARDLEFGTDAQLSKPAAYYVRCIRRP